MERGHGGPEPARDAAAAGLCELGVRVAAGHYTGELTTRAETEPWVGCIGPG